MNRFKILPVLLFAIGGPLGCDGGEEGSTSCTEDFDCPVGQICDAATEGGACTQAGAGAQRTFGKVTLDVAGTNEVWLLSVHSVPTDDEVPNDVATFYLNPAPGQALRVARQAPVEPTWDVARWDARIAFESARRRRLDRLVTGLRSGERRVAAAMPRQSACGDCGTQMCWKGSCADTNIMVAFADNTNIACDLADVVDVPGGGKINVLLDQAASAASADAVAAVEAFASTFVDQLDLFGQAAHTGDADRDADGRMTVVFTDHEGAGIDSSVVGFFWYPDFLPPSDAESTGNQSDILWARVPNGANITTEISAGTLAHEYTHLASYGIRVQARGNDALREVLWLDEGISHLMEDLTGWGASNVDTVAAALSGWSDGGFATSTDSLVQRGRAYLLLRHMVDQAGSTGATSSATVSAARTLVTGLITGQGLGWGHAEFQNLPKDGVWRMILATYATGRTDLASGANAYDFLPVGTNSTTGQVVGMNTHGSYDDGRGSTVDHDGPAVSSGLDTNPTGFDDVVTESGGVLYELTGMDAGTVTIVGRANAAVDVRLKVQKVQE